MSAALDGVPLTFPSDKTRALLAYLVIENSRAHRRGELAGLLWSELAEERARHNLSQTLLRLRQTLGEKNKATSAFFHISATEIQFNAASDWECDVMAFARIANRLSPIANRPAQVANEATSDVQYAISHYRGDFLSGLSLPDAPLFEEWLLVKREGLRTLALELLDALVAQHETQGEWDAVISCARRQIEIEAWRESAQRAIMRALARQGDRHGAQAQYKILIAILADELGIEPEPETRVLAEQIAANRSVVAVPAPAPTVQLPTYHTSFFGRTRELAVLRDSLRDPNMRLVTIQAHGGMGKTRLAVQAASAAHDSLREGARFVPLAGLIAPSEIPAALAAALGLELRNADARGQVLNHLRDQELLLVLDNLEHLLAASNALDETTDDPAALVVSLLDHAPRLRIWVTTRERLNLQAENVLRVEGLTIPPIEAAVETFSEYSAVQLTLERAQRADMNFAATPETLPQVTRLCQLVGGMPLALELAAAQVGEVPLEEIVAALELRLDEMAAALRDLPPRHRSIHAVLAQSWQRMTEAEQQQYIRLSIFQGGFTPAAATTTTGLDAAQLTRLANQSLIQFGANGRLELHEVLRQYARRRFEPAAERAARDQHSRHFAAWLGEKRVELQSAGQAVALGAVEIEFDNLRASWEHAANVGLADALAQMVEPFFLFFKKRSRFQEGATLFEHAARETEQTQGRSGLWARLWARSGYCLERLGKLEQARARLEESSIISAAAENVADVVFVNRQLGHFAHQRGDYVTARQILEKTLTLTQAHGLRQDTAYVLNNLGMIAHAEGDYTTAREHYRASLALKRELGETEAIAVTLNNLGEVAYLLTHWAEAKRYWGESLALRRELGDRHGVSMLLDNLGQLAFENRAYSEARRLHHESLTLKRALQDRRGIAGVLGHLAKIAIALERDTEAETYLDEASELARADGALPIAMENFVTLAKLAARRGDSARAFELATLVSTNAASWQDTRLEAQRFLAELRAAE